jgi:hypothetical protein
MATFYRANGDAQAVVNVGTATKNANAVIINTGLASPITAYKIAGITGTGAGPANLAAELGAGGAVETILRAVAANASILAYQVDASSQISVIVERSGWTSDTAAQNMVQGLLGTNGFQGGNIGGYSNVCVGAATVSSTGGIKLA